MLTSASPGRGGGDGAGAAASYRVIGNDRKFRSTDSGAQCRALSPDFPAGARGLYPLARGCRIRPARGMAPALQRMKLKPDQAFGHREVFCFFLVFHRALPDLQRMKLKPDQAIGHREVFCFFLAELLLADSGADDGARAIGADADRLRLVGAAAMVPAPIERREVRGHRQQIGKSAALTVGALALALSTLRPLRLRKISGSCSFCSFWSARSSGPPPNVWSVAVARRRVSTQPR